MPATMDDIPEELIDEIVPYLGYTKDFYGEKIRRIGALATVSAKWQRVVERQTFKHLKLSAEIRDSDDDGLGVLEWAVLSNPRRRSYVHFLRLTIHTPDFSHRPDLKQFFIDSRFGSGLARLFAGLASAEAQAEADGQPMSGIVLQIMPDMGAKCQDKIVVRSRINRDSPPPAGAAGDDDDQYSPPLVGGYGWDSSPPPLPPLRLPVLRCVSSLELFVGHRFSRLCLRTAFDMARSLPALSRLDTRVSIHTYYEPGIIKHSRDRRDLAGALMEAASSPPPLRHVTLSIDEQDGEGGILSNGDGDVFGDMAVLGTLSVTAAAAVAEPIPSVEPLGPALRTWSHNLVSLELCGLFDSSLFWPHESEPSSAATLPSWPNLKNLSVKLGCITPRGRWYFDRLPYSAHPDTFHYRRKPSEDELQPLFAAWSRALERMRLLESATVYFKPSMVVRDDETGSDRIEKRPWLVAY